jgi:hypothetical protein
MYAWETGPVDDIAMLLLCGECEFKVNLDPMSTIHFHSLPSVRRGLRDVRPQD